MGRPRGRVKWTRGEWCGVYCASACCCVLLLFSVLGAFFLFCLFVTTSLLFAGRAPFSFFFFFFLIFCILFCIFTFFGFVMNMKRGYAKILVFVGQIDHKSHFFCFDFPLLSLVSCTLPNQYFLSFFFGKFPLHLCIDPVILLEQYWHLTVGK